MRKYNSSQVKVFLLNIMIIGFLSVIFSICLSKINSSHVEIKAVEQHHLLMAQLTNTNNLSSHRIYIWDESY